MRTARRKSAGWVRTSRSSASLCWTSGCEETTTFDKQALLAAGVQSDSGRISRSVFRRQLQTANAADQADSLSRELRICYTSGGAPAGWCQFFQSRRRRAAVLRSDGSSCRTTPSILNWPPCERRRERVSAVLSSCLSLLAWSRFSIKRPIPLWRLPTRGHEDVDQAFRINYHGWRKPWRFNSRCSPAGLEGIPV